MIELNFHSLPRFIQKRILDNIDYLDYCRYESSSRECKENILLEGPDGYDYQRNKDAVENATKALTKEQIFLFIRQERYNLERQLEELEHFTEKVVLWP